METNEQWRQGGDCTKCRRASYCSKPCTLRKRIHKAELQKCVASVLNRATGGVMSDIIKDALYVTGYGR